MPGVGRLCILHDYKVEVVVFVELVGRQFVAWHEILFTCLTFLKLLSLLAWRGMRGASHRGKNRARFYVVSSEAVARRRNLGQSVLDGRAVSLQKCVY